MTCPRPLVKYALYAKTTLNENKPEWVDEESTVIQELEDAITLFALQVLKFPRYELPKMPRMDAHTAADLLSMFIVWRDFKSQLTTNEQQYFWGLDVGARACLNQLPPQEYVAQLRHGYTCNLTSKEFTKSTQSAADKSNEDGVYEQVVESMRGSLDALALQLKGDKYNEALHDAYMNLHYQLHHLNKQVAVAWSIIGGSYLHKFNTMFSANLELTPEDLRVLHNAYTFLYEYRRHFDKLGVPDDEYYRALFKPESEEDLKTLNKIRLRGMVAMNEQWQALPNDSPYLKEYYDKAELWVPFEHEIEQIQQILDS